MATAAAPRLRLHVEESESCERGMIKDMRRDHTLACQKKLMETEDTRQGSTDAGLLTWKESLHRDERVERRSRKHQLPCDED